MIVWSWVKVLCVGLAGYLLKMECIKLNGKNEINADVVAMDALLDEAKTIVFTPNRVEELDVAA